MCTYSCTRYVPVFLCRMLLVAPLVFFPRPILCFRGARRSSMMFPCVCVASRKVRAFFFSAGFLLGTFQAGFSVFFVSWTNLLVFGRLALLFFCIVDPQGHIFVPAGAARPPPRRQMMSPSRFPPLPAGRFSDHFLLLFCISRNSAVLRRLSSLWAGARFCASQVAQNLTSPVPASS